MSDQERLALVAGAPSTASAAEPEILYPAKVITMEGRVFRFESLGHEKVDGSFVIYDGETEGRVSWRDIDQVCWMNSN